MTEHSDSTSDDCKTVLSIIIPFFNDETLVTPLVRRLREVFGDDRRYEFILIDDGSIDLTFESLSALCKEDRRFSAIRLDRNCGQRSAITAGMKRMGGKMAATMDPDLQNDPADILKLAGLITPGTELVNGYRKTRHESLFGRRIPSFLTNRILSLVSGVRMKDFGCPMAVFSIQLVQETIKLSPSGLFSKTLASILGRGVKEAPISHAPRRAGSSSYTFLKLVKMFHFLAFSALELRLILMGLSPGIIKAGLIWALTLNVLFIVTSLAAESRLLILLIFTLLFLTAFARSVMTNNKLKRRADPVAEIL